MCVLFGFADPSTALPVGLMGYIYHLIHLALSYLSFDSYTDCWLVWAMSSSMLVAKFLSRLLGSPLLCLESRVVLLVRANLGWLWFAYCLLLYYTFMWCKFHTLDYRAGSFVWTSHFCLLYFPDLCFRYRMFMLVFYLPV